MTNDTPEITLTLDPFGEKNAEAAAEAAAAVTEEQASKLAEAHLSEAEMQAVREFAAKIDVTDTGAAVGDVVTLFGNDPKELYAYADRAGTIDYECLCLVASRVIRVYR